MTALTTSLGKRRVLVIAVNYAPEPGGTAPYTADAAEHLASLGHTVEVVTGMPHYPSWRVAPEYVGRFRVREVRKGVQLRRLRHYVPSSQSAAKRAVYEASFALHALVSPRMREPDVVLAVVPSITSAAAAAVIARSAHARLVVWLQDSVSRGARQTGMRGGHAIAHVIELVENRVLCEAATVIVISDAFEHQVRDVGVPAERVRQVRNWTHIAPPTIERPEMRRRMGWQETDLIALHAGNMGLKQGLENVVDAGRIAQERGSAVRFVLMGDGNQRRTLQERARGLSTVVFVPPSSDEEYSSVLAAADVLVVNERFGVKDMSLPSKLTSYLCAGRPVIAAVAADGGTAAEVRRTNIGTVVRNDQPEALLDEVPRATLAAVDVRRPTAAHASAALAKAQLTEILTGACRA